MTWCECRLAGRLSIYPGRRRCQLLTIFWGLPSIASMADCARCPVPGLIEACEEAEYTLYADLYDDAGRPVIVDGRKAADGCATALATVDALAGEAK